MFDESKINTEARRELAKEILEEFQTYCHSKEDCSSCPLNDRRSCAIAFAVNMMLDVDARAKVHIDSLPTQNAADLKITPCTETKYDTIMAWTRWFEGTINFMSECQSIDKKFVEGMVFAFRSFLDLYQGEIK